MNNPAQNAADKKIFVKVCWLSGGIVISNILFQLSQVAPEYLLSGSLGVTLIYIIWYGNLGVYYLSQVAMVSLLIYMVGVVLKHLITPKEK